MHGSAHSGTRTQNGQIQLMEIAAQMNLDEHVHPSTEKVGNT